MNAIYTGQAGQIVVEQAFIAKQPRPPQSPYDIQCFLVGFDWQGDYHLYRGTPRHLMPYPVIKDIARDEPHQTRYIAPNGILYTENKMQPVKEPVFHGTQPCALTQLFHDDLDRLVRFVRRVPQI